MLDNMPLHDDIIYQEMMSHSALFSHPHPKLLIVIGDGSDGIVQEILKHEQVIKVWHITEHTPKHINDPRVEVFVGIDQWLSAKHEDLVDIIIVTEEAKTDHFKDFFQLLNPNGMVIQKSESPFHLKTLKFLQNAFIESGFPDIHFLSFPQPHFTTGWRTAIIAKKHGNFRRIREKDIYNKTFPTRYYNYDAHKASLALPEFMREELEPIPE